MKPDSSARPAFSMSELVLVILIIGIVLLLIVPLGFRTRIRDDNRMKCRSQLMQMLLAAQACHDAEGSIPANPVTKGSVRGSTQYWLLPYLEGANLYNQGSSAFSQRFKLFECPSDPTVPTLTGPPGSWYAGCYVTNGNTSAPGSLFGRNVTLSSITDGTAYTIIFTEKYGACSSWSEARAGAFPPSAGVAPLAPLGGYNPSYLATPTSGIMLPPAEVSTVDCSLPSSGHRAGINVGMCDGSARTVRPAVSARTWYAATTPNGGEPLDKSTPRDWEPVD